MNKATRLAAAAGIFLVLAIIMGISYAAIGQEIAADGTLVEPFALIPLTYLAALIGVVLLATSSFLALGDRRRTASTEGLQR